MSTNIYDYIKTEEARFETEEVQIGDNWFFNLRRHIQLIFHLKNGIFFTGENDWLRAFKNIMEPILELCYWTEDIEVKDTTFFLDGENDRALSFLVKKYHDEIYSREHNLDEMFDEITETDIDYGGVLVQRGVERPEVLTFNSLAFADQTDLLGGPLAFKHYFTPSKLKEMAKFGWGDEKNGATISLDELCLLATFQKDALGTQNDKQNNVPGKTIEVYIVRGNMPMGYLKDNDDMETSINQLQIVAFYTTKDSKKQGVCLYRKEEEDGNLKFFTFKKIPGRAVGRGVGERLVHPQVWTNWSIIHKNNLLEAGSKVPLVTDDESYSNKNQIQDMENLEITTIEDGKTIRQIPTASPVNIQLLDSAIMGWYQHGQFVGNAFDSLMGKEESSGTTFKGQERLVAQGRGPHDRRRGQRAKFIEEIYQDWIIPDIKKAIASGKKFLASLSPDELNWVADTLATNLTNERIKEMVMGGAMPTKEEQKIFTETFKRDFFKKGNKHLLELVKGELQDKQIKMGINIAGKQKNLAGMSDKILSIFQFIISNPQGFQQAMQNPALAKSFNDILEYSGLSPANFAMLQTQATLSPIQPEQEMITTEQNG